MATERYEVQVLNKADYCEQHCISIPDALKHLPPLAPLSVRIKVRLIALSAANVHYAGIKTDSKWWNDFPVPEGAPAPLNDQSKYGCVPAWGYSEIIESTSLLKPGTLLYGFWPVSSVPFDIKLGEVDPKDEWVSDKSDHRKGQESISTRYYISPLRDFRSLPEKTVEELSWIAIIRSLWASSYLLNRFVFSDGDFEPIHPYRVGPESVWTKEDADLSQSVIVQFAAASKTAMCLAYEFKTSRKAGSGPLGMLAITSIPELKWLDNAPFPVKIADYPEVGADSTVAWLKERNPKRIITFDYGGRDGSLEAFSAAAKKALPDVEIMDFLMGLSAKKLKGGLPPISRRSNPSGQREDAVKVAGMPKLGADSDRLWKKAWDSGELTNQPLFIGEGIVGPEAVEGNWDKLTRGDYTKAVGLSFKL